MTKQTPIGCWLAAPDIVFIEIAAKLGYQVLVLDVEHGTLDLKDLDRLIPFAKQLGLDVLVKVEGPRQEPIQQALDFGANGVVIPHIGDLAHATEITRAAKYPIQGTRSFAGARSVSYAAPSSTYFEDDNHATRCFPMIETAEALENLDNILALDTVDGVFIGPSDLSLTRGRGRYGFTDADRADISKIASACAAADKPWIIPCWTQPEQVFAEENGASCRVIIEQQGAMADGLMAAIDAIKPR